MRQNQPLPFQTRLQLAVSPLPLPLRGVHRLAEWETVGKRKREAFFFLPFPFLATNITTFCLHVCHPQPSLPSPSSTVQPQPQPFGLSCICTCTPANNRLCWKCLTPIIHSRSRRQHNTGGGKKKKQPASRYMQLMVAVRHAASTFRVWITVACDAREEDLPLDRKPRVPPRQRCVLDCRVRRHAQRTPFPPCYAHPAATCQPCAATCFC